MCRNTHPLFYLLPSVALDDVAFIVRYDAASHGHVIVVEIRADTSCGLVSSCGKCNEHGSGYGDALDVKVIIARSEASLLVESKGPSCPQRVVSLQPGARPEAAE